MSSGIPSKFTDLWTASTSNNHCFITNVMGIVTDALPASKTRGTDFCCTFSLVDGKYGNFGSTGEEGLKVRYFRPVPEDLPPVENKGDIVILRNMKFNKHHGMNIIISTRTSGWTLLPAATVPKKVNSSKPLHIPYTKNVSSSAPSHEELKYAMELCNSRDESLSGRVVSSPNVIFSTKGTISTFSSQGRKDKFSLVKDLEVETYYDIVGQVVKLYPDNDRSDLYLSDYTSNGLLWNYIDPKQYEDTGHDDWLTTNR